MGLNFRNIEVKKLLVITSGLIFIGASIIIVSLFLFKNEKTEETKDSVIRWAIPKCDNYDYVKNEKYNKIKLSIETDILARKKLVEDFIRGLRFSVDGGYSDVIYSWSVEVFDFGYPSGYILLVEGKVDEVRWRYIPGWYKKELLQTVFDGVHKIFGNPNSQIPKHYQSEIEVRISGIGGSAWADSHMKLDSNGRLYTEIK
jgi:hypothetical protein